MDKKGALSAYQFGERSKSELMIASQLITKLSGLKDQERSGGVKIVMQCLESVRMEITFANRMTGLTEFQKAVEGLNTVISLVESNDLDGAVRQVGTAMTHVTTVAAQAWQELEKHELV